VLSTPLNTSPLAQNDHTNPKGGGGVSGGGHLSLVLKDTTEEGGVEEEVVNSIRVLRIGHY